MCDKCDRVDELLAELNAGKRTFDRDLMEATLAQSEHVLAEMLTDVRTGTSPLHELLEECSRTMAGLGVGLVVNARTVRHASHVERERLVQAAVKAEQATLNRKALIDHIVNQHNANGDYDPAKLLLAEYRDLQHIHHQTHLPHVDCTSYHLETGR